MGDSEVADAAQVQLEVEAAENVCAVTVAESGDVAGGDAGGVE